jgi:hypothetical protein
VSRVSRIGGTPSTCSLHASASNLLEVDQGQLVAGCFQGAGFRYGELDSRL